MAASQPANFNLQEFTDAGVLLVGGRLYTYAYGTTAQKNAFTDPAGTVPHAYTADGAGGQYIALNARGELPAPLYLGEGSYDITLKRADGSTVWTRKADGVDNAVNALAKPGGAGNVGYGPRTVKDALDALYMADYDAVRAYKGGAPLLFVIDLLKAGPFALDADDTSTPDDGAMCVVTAEGLRYKRIFAGEDIYAEWFGADPKGVGDSYSPGQNACNYASSNGRLTVRFGQGTFKLSQGIKTCDVTAPAGTTACALKGAGQFTTTFVPSGDFTAIKFVSSYLECCHFNVDWPVTAKAAIPAARIGVEFADGDHQVAHTLIHHITVSYAYRGFVLNDWTGKTFGTMYLVTLMKLTAFRCADWGFYLNSKTGSTTLRVIQCYVRGDDSAGGAAAGKGFYAFNFNDVYIEQIAVDQCLDSWLTAINYNVCELINPAFESNKMASAGATAVLLQGTQTRVTGFKDISNSYDTGGNARVIYAGSQTQLTVDGYNEQFSTVAAGTNKYRVAFNAAATDVAVLDRTILPAHVLDNGWYANVVYQGVRRSRIGTPPNYGTWVQGDYVKNAATALGQPKGWYCTAAGTPGTWVSEGNL